MRIPASMTQKQFDAFFHPDGPICQSAKRIAMKHVLPCRGAWSRLGHGVEDLAQELILEVLNNAHKYNPAACSFEGFAYVIMRSRALNHRDKLETQGQNPRLPMFSLDIQTKDSIANWEATLTDDLDRKRHVIAGDLISELGRRRRTSRPARRAG